MLSQASRERCRSEGTRPPADRQHKCVGTSVTVETARAHGSAPVRCVGGVSVPVVTPALVRARAHSLAPLPPWGAGGTIAACVQMAPPARDPARPSTLTAGNTTGAPHQRDGHGAKACIPP